MREPPPYTAPMIARLVLVLLMVVAAMPTMAAGRGFHQGMVIEGTTRPMVTMPEMPAIPAHHDHGAPADHCCTGCVPLPEAPRAHATSFASRVRLPRPVPTRFGLRGAGPPALPPPRIG